MKLTKQQITDEIYRQFRGLIFEEIEQTDPSEDPYERIKKLGELGKKIESQIHNSLTHLNSFLSIGTKAQDSFEFRRAVAEIQRIQKLATDYGSVITKAHEIADGHPASKVDQPAQEAKKPEPDDSEIVNKGGDKTIYEVKGNVTPGWYITDKSGNPVHGPFTEKVANQRLEDMTGNFEVTYFSDYDISRMNEGDMSQLAQEIDDIHHRNTRIPSMYPSSKSPIEVVVQQLQKNPKYAKISRSELTKMVTGYLGQRMKEGGPGSGLNQTSSAPTIKANKKQDSYLKKAGINQSENPADRRKRQGIQESVFGLILRNQFDESVKTIDVKAVSLKEAALLGAQGFPGWEIKHIIVKEGWADQNPEKCYTCQSHDLDDQDRCTGCKKVQDKCSCSGDYAERDIRETWEELQKGGKAFCGKCGYDERWSTGDACPCCHGTGSPKYTEELSKKPQWAWPKPGTKNEDLQGNAGSGVVMQPHQSELNDEKIKVKDAKGQDLNIRDRVIDQVWDEKQRKYVWGRESYRVERIVNPGRIVVLDLQTKAQMAMSPGDVQRVGKTHVYEDTKWMDHEGMHPDDVENYTMVCSKCGFKDGINDILDPKNRCPKCKIVMQPKNPEYAKKFGWKPNNEGGPGSGRKTNAFVKTRNKQIKQGDIPNPKLKYGQSPSSGPKAGLNAYASDRRKKGSYGF